MPKISPKLRLRRYLGLPMALPIGRDVPQGRHGLIDERSIYDLKSQVLNRWLGVLLLSQASRIK